MFRTFLGSCLLLAVTLLAGAEEPALGTFSWGPEEPPPEVEETGRLQVIEDPGRDNFVNTPRGSQAARFTVDQKLFDWQPSPDPGRVTGGARILSVALSPDESALAVLERVGRGEEGPFGSRIVIFNLFHGGIVNVLSFPDQAFCRIWFPPEGDRILALEQGQPRRKTETGLRLIDPASGAELARSRALKALPASLVVVGSTVYYKLPEDPLLYFLPLAQLESEPGTYLARQPGGLLLASPDGSALIGVGPGVLEFLSLEGGKPEPRRVAELPDSFRPRSGAAVTEQGNGLLLAGEDGSVLFWFNGSLRPVTSGATGLLDWNASSKLALVGLEKNGAFACYRLPASLQPAFAELLPAKLQPVTRGEALFARLLTSGEEHPVLVLDHRCNLMRFTTSKTRWKKELLFSLEPVRK